MYDATRIHSQANGPNRGAKVGPARGGFPAILLLACSVGLASAQTLFAADSGGMNAAPTAVASTNTVDQPDFWIGKNISAVVRVLGQPTYWNANHDGGGGGNRYIYSNPGQPHFVFETQPGQTIVRAVRIP